MADRPNNEADESAANAPSEAQQADAEYGLGALMNPDEEQLKKVRESSGYHYSEDQLDHKEDRIDR
jgi:hypothetical protein